MQAKKLLVFKEESMVDVICYKCLFCQALGPEFIRMADEQQIVLELPGSIVVHS